jgi:hypothetical protein
VVPPFPKREGWGIFRCLSVPVKIRILLLLRRRSCRPGGAFLQGQRDYLHHFVLGGALADPDVELAGGVRVVISSVIGQTIGPQGRYWWRELWEGYLLCMARMRIGLFLLMAMLASAQQPPAVKPTKAWDFWIQGAWFGSYYEFEADANGGCGSADKSPCAFTLVNYGAKQRWVKVRTASNHTGWLLDEEWKNGKSSGPNNFVPQAD